MEVCLLAAHFVRICSRAGFSAQEHDLRLQLPTTEGQRKIGAGANSIL